MAFGRVIDVNSVTDRRSKNRRLKNHLCVYVGYPFPLFGLAGFFSLHSDLLLRVTYSFCLRLAIVTTVAVHPTIRLPRATIGLLLSSRRVNLLA